MRAPALNVQPVKRPGIPAGPRSADPLSKHLEWLGRQLTEVSQHEILGLAVQHGGRQPLVRVSEAGRNVQRAVDELSAAGGKRTAPPTPELTQLLSEHRRALDQLRQYCLAWDGVRKFLANWNGLTQRLLEQTPVTLDELNELAAQAEAWTALSAGLSADVFWPVIRALCEVPGGTADQELWQELAEDAVHAAWLVQQSLETAWDWKQARRTILLAAVFKDVGRLSLAPHLAAAARRGPELLASFKVMHPRVSASMLGSVPGISSRFTLIIGHHHERLDGSGPFRASADRLLMPDRFLGAVARLIELHRTRKANTRNLVGLLEQESNRDWWDADCVGLLRSVDEGGDLAAAFAPFAAQDRTDAVHELHGEHAQPPESHLNRGVRGSNTWHEMLPQAANVQ